MKTTTTFFIFLFISIFSFAQDSLKVEDNFFFKTEIDSLGECYGKCLIQAQFDTLNKEITIEKEIKKITSFKYYHYDTVHYDFYYLFIGSPNLKYIIDNVDTSTQMILIKEEDSKLTINRNPNFENDCLEKVTEQYLKMPSYKKWDFKKGNNANSENWEKSKIEEVYATQTKTVIKTPDCGGIPLVEKVPAEYFTAIKIIPKENISEHQLNNMKLLCNNSYINKTLKTRQEEKLIKPAVKGIEKEIKLLKSATTELIKTPCEITPSLILKIQKQLYALGFYSGNFQGEFNDEIKAAIIKYQVKNNLPIGQLDNETIEHILSRKTPFK